MIHFITTPEVLKFYDSIDAEPRIDMLANYANEYYEEQPKSFIGREWLMDKNDVRRLVGVAIDHEQSIGVIYMADPRFTVEELTGEMDG